MSRNHCVVGVFINGVDFFKFALAVELNILCQDFATTDGETVRLSARRAFGPLGHRLEIHPGPSYPYSAPITLDFQQIADNRMLVAAACHDDCYRPALDKILDDIHVYWDIPRPALARRLPPSPRTQTPASSEEDKPSERTVNLSTALQVAEAKYLMLVKKLGKRVACDQADICHHTYNRWEDDETVNRLLQEMMRDRPDL